MNKNEVREKVTKMLSAGEKKQDVFAGLSGKGVKDRVLAYLIASHVDLRRCAQNRIYRRIAIALAYFHVVGAVDGGHIVAERSLPIGLVFGAISLLFAALFVWGFSKNKAGVYNVYLILALIQFPLRFLGLSENPLTISAIIAIGMAMITYVWFVRQRLFPDLGFIGARKVDGRYVFSD
ncbi:hypothetical protein [Burkholderia sp. L27(2015)]|uniref:hypothetical protein n=1 Tax=Burkholderia sp. L27(2015) TaxID=1641858 RepID=UPI00131D906B|nr:hypothetical protein [Burkholderia sp. L27(2015)]